MSKIVCDVCGTSYPETATQCPICGNAKSEKAATLGNLSSQDSGYAYVKGGRFSHSNVRKRNNGKTELPRTVAPAKPEKERTSARQAEVTPVAQPAPASDPQITPRTQPMAEPRKEVAPVLPEVQEMPKAEPKRERAPVPPVVPTEPRKESAYVQPATQPEQKAERQQTRSSANSTPEHNPRPDTNPRRRERQPQKETRSSNVGLLIIVVILILAIVVVCAYIAIRLMNLGSRPTLPNSTTTTTSQFVPTGSSSASTPITVPCTGIKIQLPSYTFVSKDQTLLLNVEKQPANTTDIVTFESDDPSIASVDANGLIKPVGDGYVIITIRCGDGIAYCEITCDLPDEPTQPSTSKPTQPTQPSHPYVKLELKSNDITLNSYGETFMLYNGDLDPASITWTSEDESIVTIVNGLVRAVGKGTAKVYAEYGDQKAECIVRCERVVVSDYELHNQYTGFNTQITMRVGEKIKFYLVNRETGEKVAVSEVTFSVSNDKYISVDENGVVTAIAKSGTRLVNLVVEYNGVTYKCQIIVVDP